MLALNGILLLDLVPVLRLRLGLMLPFKFVLWLGIELGFVARIRISVGVKCLEYS